MPCAPDSIEEFVMGFRVSRNAARMDSGAKKLHKSGTSLLSQRPHPPLIYSPSHPMSSFAPDLGDAVRPDGTLKDASEMTWSFDADDSIPFPLGDASGDASGGRVSSGEGEPPGPTATLRRTTRVIRPAQRYLDRAKSDSSAPTSTPLTTKHKASGKSPVCCVVQKVINLDSEDNEDNNMSGDDSSATTEPATEPASDGYEAVQAMVDTDMVCSHRLSLFGWYPQLLPRLWLSLGRGVVQQTYTSSSASRKGTYIQLQGRF
jgi:hypothetical protein